MANKQIKDLTLQSTLAATDQFALDNPSDITKKVYGTTLKNVISDTISSNYTVLDDDNYSTVLIDTSSSNVTVELPTLADNQGRYLSFQVIDDTNLCTIDGEGTETIAGVETIELPKIYDRLTIFAGSTEWLIIEERISCQLRLDGYAGRGSVDTAILQYTTSRENYGNVFSENHSTGYNGNTEGLEITINKSGKYGFSMSSETSTATVIFGLSLNSTQLTTAINFINNSDVLSLGRCDGSSLKANASWQGYLSKNDIIRAHSMVTTPDDIFFTASYLGN